ncbi:glycosyltransferase family 2 protein [Neorhizobium sp. NCHU2750]|uniref:glycosyltransferase family 2 protein n=1 Tax=Neorhizobium sp. NCHU2750 TaxID=1825976 RepID=UPI000E7324C2|nr:succinoglycan biosynthesis glycosyltransferase [Neorhizobium sp. NCHU2750]
MIVDASRPDVSFIIAAYNAEDTLKRAIDSALSQVGVTVEVVVIDDCSSDDTVEIAESYSDPRVRLIRQAQNGGPGKARNAGIAAATGRWIATLDSDDAVKPERMLSMILKAKELEAQVVVDNVDVVPIEGGAAKTMFDRQQLARQHEITLSEFITSNLIFKTTFNFGYMKPIFLRDFLIAHDLKFDDMLKIGEDYILFASALAAGARCAVDPNVGYVYYLRQGSISRVLKQQHLDDMLEGDRRFLSRYTLGPAEMAAQQRRTRSIIEARSFLTLVDEVKRKSVGGFLKTAMQAPGALKHFRMPIAVRMRRFVKATGVN